MHMPFVNGVGVGRLRHGLHQGQRFGGGPAADREVHGLARQVPGVGHAAYCPVVGGAAEGAAGDSDEVQLYAGR